MTFNPSKLMNITKNNEMDNHNQILSNMTRYGLLLSLIIPSILAYLLSFAFLFDIPLVTDSYASYPLVKQTNSLCLAWTFVETSFFYAINLLFVWVSFERHLLIFNANIFNNKW
ncbi:hypothetical protein I4U23_016425 [Adineta vaga]|nr:hypothetical protein I4U23_016425 [Adineta vaga]